MFADQEIMNVDDLLKRADSDRLKSDTKSGTLLMAVEECHSLLAQIHGHSLSISIGIFTDKIIA